MPWCPSGRLDGPCPRRILLASDLRLPVEVDELLHLRADLSLGNIVENVLGHGLPPAYGHVTPRAGSATILLRSASWPLPFKTSVMLDGPLFAVSQSRNF